MDRGAWRATVHGFAKSRTQLSEQQFYFYFFFLWSCGFIGVEIVCKLNNSARIVFVRMCVGKGWGIFASFYPYPVLSQECCGEKLPVFPGSHWWDGTPLASPISSLFCSSWRRSGDREGWQSSLNFSLFLKIHISWHIRW